MEKYTKEYFIEKFEAIPDELFTMCDLTNPKNSACHCALGHCGVEADSDGFGYIYTKEALALSNILIDYHTSVFGFAAGIDSNTESNVWRINDDETKSLGKTPKERILNALKKS